MSAKKDFIAFYGQQKRQTIYCQRYMNNIWNGLSIFKQREDSIELWGFAADRQAENMQSFYIENLDLLKKFITAFNRNASEIITPTSSNLAIYKDFKIKAVIIDDYELKKINEFIKATNVNKHPIITQKGEVFLSKKELLCISNLAAGKSAKQIASGLGSSQRTIEKHVENIKNKLGCHDKAALIKIYKDSVLNWL